MAEIISNWNDLGNAFWDFYRLWRISISKDEGRGHFSDLLVEIPLILQTGSGIDIWRSREGWERMPALAGDPCLHMGLFGGQWRATGNSDPLYPSLS